MNFSSDDAHRATLGILREALTYLERMPQVPVTREFCRKLQAHLDEPTQRLLADGRRELHGLIYSSAGIPLLSAVVADDKLELKLSAHHEIRAEPEALVACVAALVDLILDGGLKLPLTARNGSRSNPETLS